MSKKGHILVKLTSQEAKALGEYLLTRYDPRAPRMVLGNNPNQHINRQNAKSIGDRLIKAAKRKRRRYGPAFKMEFSRTEAAWVLRCYPYASRRFPIAPVRRIVKKFGARLGLIIGSHHVSEKGDNETLKHNYDNQKRTIRRAKARMRERSQRKAWIKEFREWDESAVITVLSAFEFENRKKS